MNVVFNHIGYLIEPLGWLYHQMDITIYLMLLTFWTLITSTKMKMTLGGTLATSSFVICVM